MREGRKWILTNQKIDSENILYEWVSEPGACKVCQEMDGKVYESANDIPDRPHPNCKCHIELIEKEREITDPIGIYQEQRREKQRVILEIQKAQGDILSMTEEIEEFLKQVDEEETKLTQLKNIIDINNLEKENIEKLNKAFEQVEFARFRGEKVKKELSNLLSQSVVLEGGVEKVRILGPLFEKILKEALEKIGGIIRLSKVIASTIKELTGVILNELKKGNKDILNKLVLTKTAADIYGKHHSAEFNMPESYNLYRIASNGNLKYLTENNTKIYDSINDLHDYKLEKDIRARLKLEKDFYSDDCKVIKMNIDSSLSKKIEDSNAIKRFVTENIKEIQDKQLVSDTKEIIFENDDADLYSTFHSAAIKNIYMDNEKNIHARIEDFWNFNPGRTSIKGKVGKYLQDNGLLTPFYIIIEIEIPKYKIQTYKI